MDSTFRHLFLPYCLERQPDGRYAVLNRKYKPMGINGPAWVVYADHNAVFKIKGLTAAKAAKISHDGSTDLARIWLYNDGCVPTDSSAHWDAYTRRLQELAKLKLVMPG